jgi:phosphopantetheinyl transferase
VLILQLGKITAIFSYMPFIYQHQINQSSQLGVWHIAEEESFFLRKVPLQRNITHPHKRLQHLAGRYLLTELVPDFPLDLIKIADTRKPFLANEAWHFSLSHCGDYAAAIVSPTQRVGVDVELVSEKVARVQGKFLGQEELAMLNSLLGRVDGGQLTDDGSRWPLAVGREPLPVDRLEAQPTPRLLPDFAIQAGSRRGAEDRIRLTVDGGHLTGKGETLAVDRGSLTGDRGEQTVDGGQLTESRLPTTFNFQLSTFNLLTACWSIKEALFKWKGSGEIDFRQHLRIESLAIKDNEGIAHCRVLKDGDTALTVQVLFFGGVCLSWVCS